MEKLKIEKEFKINDYLIIKIDNDSLENNEITLNLKGFIDSLNSIDLMTFLDKTIGNNNKTLILNCKDLKIHFNLWNRLFY